MTKVIKRLIVFFGTLMFFIACFNIHITFAKEPNAKDCLEGTVDCNEEEQRDGNITDEESLNNTLQQGSLGFDLFKMVFFLIIVLALIYFLLKFLGKRTKMYQQASALESLGGISVGQNKSLQIIRVGTKIYLIGVGNNVDLLQEIDDDVLKEQILNQAAERAQGFSSIQSLFGKLSGNKQAVESEDKEFKQSFEKELEKIKRNRQELIRSHQRDERNE